MADNTTSALAGVAVYLLTGAVSGGGEPQPPTNGDGGDDGEYYGESNFGLGGYGQ